MMRSRPPLSLAKLGRAVHGLALAFALAVAATPASAYESDVHFGLTKWLALRAGFEEWAADAIGLGDQRQDGGMMETLALSLEYACLTPDPTVAREVQQRHYPALLAVPALPAERRVEPGGAAARRALREMAPRLPGKEGLMLGKYGEALHPLQDSWSHQGLPGGWQSGSFPCDAGLMNASGNEEGGPGAHDVDQTRHSPDTVLAMAQATYEALLAYPPIQGRARKAADWPSLVAAVREFAKLASKTAKRDWFVREGIPDTTFLEGITLPDGPAPGRLEWMGRKLPELTRSRSIQHDVPPDILVFYDELLRRWLSEEPVDQLVRDVAGARTKSQFAGPTAREQQLTARLALWKWRDHGSAAALAHAAAPLTRAQLAAASRLTRDPKGYVRSAPANALFPLQPLRPDAAPLVPYIVRPLPSPDKREPRMIALLRLRHAPYDTLGLIAERHENSWRLIDVVSAVEP